MRIEIFTFKEMDVGEMWIGKSSFITSFVYYFGDLLKSAKMAFLRHMTFISL